MKYFLPILAVAGLVSIVAVNPISAFSAEGRSANGLEGQRSLQSSAVVANPNTDAPAQLHRRVGVQRRRAGEPFANAQSASNAMLYVLTNDPVSGAPGFDAADPANGGFVPIGDASALPPDLGHALLP